MASTFNSSVSCSIADRIAARRQLLYPWQSKEQLVNFLQQNIIYSNNGIVAVNKPYGLAVDEGKMLNKMRRSVKTLPLTEKFSLQGCLSDLSNVLGMKQLYLVKSTEKYTSGVALLAETEQITNSLKRALIKQRARGESTRAFRAVTVGIPRFDVLEHSFAVRMCAVGDIYLPIKELNVTKSALKAGLVKQSVIKSHILSANEHYNCALVELWPSSVKWHMLRVFLVSRLAPIYGDHTYSARVKSVMNSSVEFDPRICQPQTQVLPTRIKQCLDLETEEEVEEIPLHLHCYSSVLRLPCKKVTQDVTIVAPFPAYFLDTLRRLKLDVSA